MTAAAAWAAALHGRIRPVLRDRDGERFPAARAAVAGSRRVAVRESLIEFGNLAQVAPAGADPRGDPSVTTVVAGPRRIQPMVSRAVTT